MVSFAAARPPPGMCARPAHLRSNTGGGQRTRMQRAVTDPPRMSAARVFAAAAHDAGFGNTIRDVPLKVAAFAGPEVTTMNNTVCSVYDGGAA